MEEIGYKIDLSKIKRLDKQTEQELIERKDEPEAKKKLTENYLKYVVSMAYDYSDKGLPVDDLISEGTLGLIHAIEKFDPSKGTALSTYATYWIRQYMQRALSRNHPLRITYGAAEKYPVVRQCIERLEQMGEPVTVDAIAQETGVSKLLVNHILNAPTLISMQEELSENFTLEELLSCDPEVFQNSRQKNQNAINVALSYLTDEEQHVICSRFGLNGMNQKTYREISEELGCSHTQVTLIIGEIIRKLRHPDILDAIREEL